MSYEIIIEFVKNNDVSGLKEYIEDKIENLSFMDKLSFGYFHNKNGYRDYFYKKLKIINKRKDLIYLCCKYAGEEDHTDMISYLINEINLNPSRLSKNYDTPLHIAVRNDNIYLTEYLLNIEVEFNSRNDDGKTPLSLAVENHNVEIIKMLMDKIINDDGIKWYNSYYFRRIGIRYIIKPSSSIIHMKKYYEDDYDSKRLGAITNKQLDYDISGCCYRLFHRINLSVNEFKQEEYEILEYIINMIINNEYNHEPKNLKIKNHYMIKIFNMILEKKDIKSLDLFLEIPGYWKTIFNGKRTIFHKIILDIVKNNQNSQRESSLKLEEYWIYEYISKINKFKIKNYRDIAGDTALILAAKNKNIELCNYLIKLKYKDDIMNNRGNTYLYYLDN